MIERIVEWSASHRMVVIAAYLLITAIGVWAVTTTPLDAIPDLSENQVIVFSELMGRAPQIVEDQVTFPLVTALQGLPKVKAVRAQSMFGMSFTYVIFEDDVDLYWARSRVLEKLSAIQSSLPVGSHTELGPDGTGVGHIYWYTVEGDGYDLGTLRSLQDWFIKPQLQSVEGVAEVASVGGFVREYQVNLDPRRMELRGVTLDQVTSAVMRSNNAVGGRIVEINGKENFVRGQGYFTSLDDFRTLVLSSSNGVPVRLQDVGDVTIGALPRRGALDKNGKGEAVGGIVVMRSGENAKDVIDRVKQKIAELQPGLPQNVTLKVAYDRSDLIEAAVSNLEHTLIEEAIIVTLVVLLFLFHFPSALRIVIEIPISVLIAFLLMRIFGISSNIMSLGGIAIAIGVLVDASIVLLENAHRHIADAQLRKEQFGEPYDFHAVVVRSAQQVSRAIFFSILVIVVSFLPVFLLTGQEGKLFHPLAFTKTFALVGSAIVSITLVPVLMTLLMKGRFKTEEHNPLSRFFRKLYKPAIEWALRHRALTIAINGIALLIAIPLALNRGSEFMPPLDEGSLLFMPTLMPSVSLAESFHIMQIQDGIIKNYPEVLQVLGKVGKAETATDPAPQSMIEAIVLLKPKSQWRPGITKDKIIEDLNSRLHIPGVAIGWTQPIINRINMLSTGVRTDLGLKFFGPSLDTLEQLAVQAETILKPIPGAADVVAERVQSGAFLDIALKPEAASQYGINAGYINNIVEAAIGGVNAGTVVDGRSRFPITVRYAAGFRGTLDEVRQLPVPVNLPSHPLQTFPNSSASGQGMASGVTAMSAPSAVSGNGAMSSGQGGSSGAMGSPNDGTTSGSSSPNLIASTSTASGPYRSLIGIRPLASTQYVPLGEIATVQLRDGAPMIASENASLRSIVYLNVRGTDMGTFVANAKTVLTKQLRLPAGYTLTWSGEYEQQQHAAAQLRVMIPLVFLVIFILLFFTLGDFKEASVVMLSVPFALIGGVYLIAILDYNWSVAVWVGFIALYGVATETGVVMVVYLHEALDKRLAAFDRGERGPITSKDIYEATVDGAVLRLRPKIMTVATAMISLAPILLSTGVGSDVMKPIAAPMIGGMLTSAIHVLIVTPIIFYAMKISALKKGQLKLSHMAKWMQH